MLQGIDPDLAAQRRVIGIFWILVWAAIWALSISKFGWRDGALVALVAMALAPTKWVTK